MAVKKHGLPPENRSQLDLATLAQYIQILNNQQHYLPDPPELIQHCQDIVKCLARTPVQYNNDELWSQLHLVEAFFINLMTNNSETVRREIVTAVLEKFHSLISDPQSDACPATSAVLVVFDGTGAGDIASAARWIVEREENGPAGAGLRASLCCLYRWTYQWSGTPALGDWIMAFIKALEEHENFEILIDVSLDNIERMFIALRNSPDIRNSVADVILHVLASMRESTEALDRVAPHVDSILVALASQCGQWSRQLLQSVVDILTAYLDRLQAKTTPRLQVKYANVIICLEKHMASRGCRYLQTPGWVSRARRDGSSLHVAPSASTPPARKVGLVNNGNACYINSVIQALLATRSFSTHVVLRMASAPYWEKVGGLFATMIHAISTKLDGTETFQLVKPPFFTHDHQHDSSEFLVYLFELLHTYEHISGENFDYTKPHNIHGIAAANRLRALPSYDSDSDSSSSRRSMSPRPGGSGTAARDSGTQNRLSPGRLPDSKVPIKKRTRQVDNALAPRQVSFIDSLFGGVLLTRLECTTCHMSSLSRDAFRDLQLAFPEKPEPGKQHSVQSLLEYYCSKERLSGENRYNCRDCGQLKDAERSVLIETPPKYLILVLKNFKFEAKHLTQTKLMHSMHYDHYVTLPTVRSQAVHSTYVVYAAVIHAGTTLDSGHYYTLAKDNDQWHMYNDEVVTPSSESELNALTNCCTPYILFYRRTDVEEASTPSMLEMPESVQQTVLKFNKQFMEDMRKFCAQRP